MHLAFFKQSRSGLICPLRYPPPPGRATQSECWDPSKVNPDGLALPCVADGLDAPTKVLYPITSAHLAAPLSSVQSLSHVWLFATPWTAARQALSITNSRNLLKLMYIESLMPSSHLILCCPLLLPSVFPRIKVFSSESIICIS